MAKGVNTSRPPPVIPRASSWRPLPGDKAPSCRRREDQEQAPCSYLPQGLGSAGARPPVRTHPWERSWLLSPGVADENAPVQKGLQNASSAPPPAQLIAGLPRRMGGRPRHLRLAPPPWNMGPTAVPRVGRPSGAYAGFMPVAPGLAPAIRTCTPAWEGTQRA